MTTFLFLKDLFCKWKLSLTSLSPGDWFARWSTTVGTDIHSDASLDALLVLAEANPDEQYTAVLFAAHPGDGRLFSPNVTLVFAKEGSGLDFTDGPPDGDFDSRVSLPFDNPFQIFFNAALDDVHGSFGGLSERLPEWWGARGAKGEADPFDSHAGIQSAVNSGLTSLYPAPFVVRFQGLYYWTSQTIMTVNKQCHLRGDKMVRTRIYAMADFGSDEVLSPPYWDSGIPLGATEPDGMYFSTSFKALMTFGSSSVWSNSFRGGASNIYFIGNLAENPGLKLSLLWCPSGVGEETIFECIALTDFNCYGMGIVPGGHSNGWVLRNFTIQGFGVSNFPGEFTEVYAQGVVGDGSDDWTYHADQPIPINVGYGQWSIRDGSIVGLPDQGWVGIITGMGPQGGGGSIANIHFEHVYDCIQVGRGGGFGSQLGVLAIDNIDVYGGRNSMVRILDSFSDLAADRPTISIRNLKAVSFPEPGDAAAIPFFVMDDLWGNYAVRNTGDHVPGYIRTSKQFVVLGDQWANGLPTAAPALFANKQLHIGWPLNIQNLDAYTSKLSVWGDPSVGSTVAAPQFSLISSEISTLGKRFTQQAYDDGADNLVWLLFSSFGSAAKIRIVEGANGEMNLYAGSGAFLVNGTGKAGFGIAVPLAKMHIKTDAAIATPALTLEQLDTNEPFVNFVGTLSNDALSSLSDLTTSGAPTHHIRCKVNGTTGWIPFSTNVPT